MTDYHGHHAFAIPLRRRLAALRAVALGSLKLMEELGVAFGGLAAKADELRRDGATALFLAVDGKPGAVIAIADPIKATTRAALDTPRARCIRRSACC